MEKIVFAARNNCGRSLYRAFVSPRTKNFDVTFNNANTKGGVLKAYGYESGNKVNRIATGAQALEADNYERLVKGLIGYNAGASAERLLKCSLAEMLAGGVIKGTLNCQSEREQGKGLDYGLKICMAKCQTMKVVQTLVSCHCRIEPLYGLASVTLQT